jgi:hypothetical protein
MNSKVKISQTRRVSRINVVVNLAYSESVLDRPWWCGVDVGVIYIYNSPVGNPKRRL